MINNVVLVGRLTKAVELKTTASGVATAQFTLAVNRRFSNTNGERETDFVNCVIWRKGAENFAQYTHKGSLVGIEGRIQTRNYERDGQRVYVTEVIVENFTLLERRSESQGDGWGNSPAVKNNRAMGSNSFGFDAVEISDEDLPF